MALGAGKRNSGTSKKRQRLFPDRQQRKAGQRGRRELLEAFRLDKGLHHVCARPLASEASIKATDKVRQWSAKAALLRKASPRGCGSSIMISRNTRPGCAAITTMRVDRNTAS